MANRKATAIEIDGDDAAWLRGETLPDGVELVDVDEVEFMGRVYDRAPGSALYIPSGLDAPNASSSANWPSSATQQKSRARSVSRSSPGLAALTSACMKRDSTLWRRMSGT